MKTTLDFGGPRACMALCFRQSTARYLKVQGVAGSCLGELSLGFWSRNLVVVFIRCLFMEGAFQSDPCSQTQDRMGHSQDLLSGAKQSLYRISIVGLSGFIQRF